MLEPMTILLRITIAGKSSNTEDMTRLVNLLQCKILKLLNPRAVARQGKTAQQACYNAKLTIEAQSCGKTAQQACYNAKLTAEPWSCGKTAQQACYNAKLTIEAQS